MRVAAILLLLTTLACFFSCVFQADFLMTGSVPTGDILLVADISKGDISAPYKNSINVCSLETREITEILRSNVWIHCARWSDRHNYISFAISSTLNMPDTIYLIDLAERKLTRVFEGRFVKDSYYLEVRDQLLVIDNDFCILLISLSDNSNEVVWDSSKYINPIHRNYSPLYFLPDNDLGEIWIQLLGISTEENPILRVDLKSGEYRLYPFDKNDYSILAVDPANKLLLSSDTTLVESNDDMESFIPKAKREGSDIGKMPTYRKVDLYIHSDDKYLSVKYFDTEENIKIPLPHPIHKISW